ncbi:type I secretion system permease/ATPase [Asticcacaulis sp. AC466]|uniref:type I secretion system permease/ATPase n=1 Tax=Asticcacaulis sp. AC466 TaxID=1282362 RepID=UPI00138B0B28|nr:type I secretion system permease/ATPase [Asticcacaulis sp. AC466]
MKLFGYKSEPYPVPSASVRDVFARVRSFFISAAIFTAVINLLALSGSIFMLQVYDRVLPSHSLETLLALVVLVVGLYLATSVLEHIRAKLFARIGRFVDLSLQGAVFNLDVSSGLPGRRASVQAAPFKDLDQLRNFLSSGGPSALFDLPWIPLYVVALFLLHPCIGVLGLLGATFLVATTMLADRKLATQQKVSFSFTVEAGAQSFAAKQGAETVVAQGMRHNLTRLWSASHERAGEAVIEASDTASFYRGVSRFFRNSLQSLVLGMGAYLVITGKATGGVMIASSILLGKALSPVEQALFIWRGFVASRDAYFRLDKTLPLATSSPDTRLPLPMTRIKVDGLAIGVPERALPVLTDIHFELAAGDVLGILGPSGVGKSSFVRTFVGLLKPMRGSIRFDGSLLSQWSEEDRSAFMGYLPQSVDLFDGTVAQNICRFDTSAASEKIVEAAQAAGVEDLIRSLPDGFDSQVGPRGDRLSAGERQRIALARAFFSSPFVTVLDEPNSALDSDGERELVRAVDRIRARGGITIIIAHRSAILQCATKLMMFGTGRQVVFGARDEVLSKVRDFMPQGFAGPVK